ncbi:MAG: hypothetical protein DI578_12425 [Ectopseudomonas oleovorans]|nr:MAG: hypothetical protein DI578_12425 [Pseudomonas oleovorans]
MPDHPELADRASEPKIHNRVGGGVTPAVLPHHRTYGSVYGGSCLLTNSISELGSVDVSPAVAKRPDRPSGLDRRCSRRFCLTLQQRAHLTIHS